MFIDYSKAFNGISQVQMFDILSEMGFPKHLFTPALYNDQLTDVRWNGRHSSAFTVERGVRQGEFFLPHVFNVCTESVIRQAEIEENVINIGRNRALI